MMFRDGAATWPLTDVRWGGPATENTPVTGLFAGDIVLVAVQVETVARLTPVERCLARSLHGVAVFVVDPGSRRGGRSRLARQGRPQRVLDVGLLAQPPQTTGDQAGGGDETRSLAESVPAEGGPGSGLDRGSGGLGVGRLDGGGGQYEGGGKAGDGSAHAENLAAQRLFPSGFVTG